MRLLLIVNKSIYSEEPDFWKWEFRVMKRSQIKYCCFEKQLSLIVIITFSFNLYEG